MKTEVIMKRELFGQQISQKSKSEMFSATDLVKAGNRWRVSKGLDFFKMSAWFQLKSTKEFINELEEEFGKVKISGRGRAKHTWVHPLLFIDMALAISPKLKIEVYKWLFDSLIKYRNESGSSYKKMSGYLYANTRNQRNFYGEISGVANQIKLACNVSDWQKASAKKLELRDRIHESITLLASVLKNNEEAVRLGIVHAKKN